MKKYFIFLIIIYSFLLILEINLKFLAAKKKKFDNYDITNYNKVNLFSGEPNTPVVFCKKNNLTYQYTSDQYGFNNIKEIYLMKYVDAMLIGDYLIHGDCAINNENLYELLKKKKNYCQFCIRR